MRLIRQRQRVKIRTNKFEDSINILGSKVATRRATVKGSQKARTQKMRARHARTIPDIQKVKLASKCELHVIIKLLSTCL